MKSSRSRAHLRAFLIAAILIGTGCGYVGGPLTPLANIPSKVTDLSAQQRGNLLHVRFTVPYRTTETVLIKTPVKLDLRIGTASANFHPDEWAAQAKQITNPSLKTGIALYDVPAAEWSGKEVVIGVRAIGSNGKQSDWSNYAIVHVVPAPEIPSAPALQSTAAGVHLTWTGAGNQFRVLRKAPADENPTIVQTLPGHEYTDNSIEYGKQYSYSIQAMVDTGNGKFAESEPSPTRDIEPKDTFPPAVPTGLRADAAGDSVALIWDANTEPDLAGYRIYRSIGSGPWEKLADGNTVPSYTDAPIDHGKPYHYAISSIDKNGNESARTTPVDIVP